MLRNNVSAGTPDRPGQGRKRNHERDIRAIIAAASEDGELRDEVTVLINELNAATAEERPEAVARIISLAEDKGFALTEEDLVFEAPAEGELEDEELMVVAGGCGSSGDTGGCKSVASCGTAVQANPNPPLLYDPHKDKWC